MKSIVLIGNGGHCRSCIDIIESCEKFKIKGIIIRPQESIKTFMKYKVIGNDLDFDSCFKKNDLALICIGQIKSATRRKELFNLLIEKKISLAIVKSKYSIVSQHSIIGEGTIVMNNSIVNAGSEVGMNCILNTNSLIEHDVKIGNNCHISTGAIINGGVKIGNGCFIGSGAILREGLEIGDNSIISAGQIVMRDLPPETTYKV